MDVTQPGSEMSGFTKDEIRALLKIVSGQQSIVDSVDSIHLYDLTRKLQNALANRKVGSGIMDMSISDSSFGKGNFSFKLRFRNNNRVAIIKLIREATGFGLKEAKDVSDLGYDSSLPWGEITFINTSEYVYTHLKRRHDHPNMGSMYSDEDYRNMFQVTPLTPVTPDAPT